MFDFLAVAKDAGQAFMRAAPQLGGRLFNAAWSAVNVRARITLAITIDTPVGPEEIDLAGTVKLAGGNLSLEDVSENVRRADAVVPSSG